MSDDFNIPLLNAVDVKTEDQDAETDPLVVSLEDGFSQPAVSDCFFDVQLVQGPRNTQYLLGKSIIKKKQFDRSQLIVYWGIN